MFNNWINLREVPYLLQRLRREPQLSSKILSKLHLRSRSRVLATWADTARPAVNWWDIPLVQQRWNHMISGDAALDYHDYVSHKYWADRDGLIALSFGCGTGEKELRWAETKKFSRIDAYDLSAPRIEAAKQAAKESPTGDIVNFVAGDVYAIAMQEGGYDVMIGESSLHHFTPLETLLNRAHQFLKPGGYFIVNEFVGPTKFQWTDPASWKS